MGRGKREMSIMDLLRDLFKGFDIQVSSVDWADYEGIQDGFKIFIEVKSIKRKTIYRRTRKTRYSTIKIRVCNHRELVKHNGIYVFEIRTSKGNKYFVIMAKKLDKYLNHEIDDFKKYYGLSVGKLFDIITETFIRDGLYTLNGGNDGR